MSWLNEFAPILNSISVLKRNLVLYSNAIFIIVPPII